MLRARRAEREVSMYPRSLASTMMVPVLLLASTAAAQQKQVAIREGASDATLASAPGRERDAVTAPVKEAPAPYSPPFLGRGVIPNNVLRFDTTNAPFAREGAPGVATTMMLAGAYRISGNIGVGLRLGMDRVSVSGAETKWGFLNPQISGMYSFSLGRGFRLAASLSAAIPVGSGGGNSGDPDLVQAHKSASLARCALENAMFGVNDLTFGYAVDLAYIKGGFTAQAGVGASTGFRMRGEEVQSDTFKANSTYNLSAGYFILPQISLGAEMRYQHYLTTPSSVEKDPSTRANLTAAVGVRGHMRVGKVWMRPGASYGHGIVGPVEKNGYHLVQIDMPVAF